MKRSGKTCPSFEQLSSYFDNQEDDHSIESHIAQCEQCQEAIKHMKELDSLVKQHHEIPQFEAKQLTERIKNEVHLKLSETTGKSSAINYTSFVKIGLNVAATLFIASTILYMAVTKSKQNTSPIPTPQQPADSTCPNYDIISTNQIGNSGDVQIASTASNGNDIAFSDLESANFEETEPINSNNKSAPLANKVTTKIEPKVTQVWVVKNLDSANQLLQQQLDKLHITPRKLKKEPHIILLKMCLEKLDLVKFVKLCSNVGFELLSPAAPQPEQRNFIGNCHDKVVYRARFVKNGK